MTSPPDAAKPHLPGARRTGISTTFATPPNQAPRDYFVLPSIDMTFGRLKLADQNGLALDAYRFDTLDFFYALASRARIAEVA